MKLPPPPDRWTVDIANTERLNAIASFGFSERQARFLLNVLLHSGVFVERQYCSFAGIVHGQKSTDFIKTLVDRSFATPIATGKLHRGRMIHVHYKPLWAAVGEPDNRFRKPAAPGRMIERVMLLDAVLGEPTCTWLGPARDKRRYFIRHLESRLDAREYPHLTFGDGPEKTIRYFPDKLPIGVLLGLAFRSPFVAIVSLLPGLFPVLASGALLWGLDEGLEFASVVALLVVFGLGIDALIHFLNRLRLEERKGDAPEHAIRRARVLVGPAIILTTIVLAFGLGVTVFSDLPSLRTFGLVCGFTLLASLLADLVFLPATILLYRRYVWAHSTASERVLGR